jgi:hypothetical protein
MKSLNKLAATVAFVPVLAISSTAFAGSPGQLAGGPNYQVKNLTQNGSYSSSISATCNDEVEYSMQLSNTQYGALNNVTLKATLPSNGGQSTATATTDLGGTSGTSDSVSVSLGSGDTQTLEDGTTVLYNGSGSAIETLPDSVTTGGVNIGTLDGSTTEYVNFKVKVGCPAPTPVAPVYTCNELSITPEDNNTVKISNFGTTAQNGATFTNAVINWGDNSTNTTTANVIGQTHEYAANGSYTVSATAHFNVNGQDETAGGVNCEKVVTFSSTTPPTVTPPATTTPTPVSPTTPTTLVNTGAGSVIGIFAAASAAGAVAYRWILGRRLSRQ